ncbi:MAG: cytochrome c biogenesis protein ResB [Spirochaetales bacterium]|nr:cytochrome c biogenesis protein ResB [Spirochaetales bacterium]
MIHISIILLLLSGVYSISNRSENIVFLTEGEKENLRDGYQIVLKKFDIETYNSGFVKDWISEVEIKRYGELIRNYKIEVNKPCTVGEYKVYQYSYRKTLYLTLQDGNGRQLFLNQGSVFEAEGKNYVLSDIHKQNTGDNFYALFNEYKDLKKTNNELKLSLHDTIGPYTIVSVQAYFYSGLNIIKDNSYIIVFIAIVLMISGLIITYYKDAIKGVKK